MAVRTAQGVLWVCTGCLLAREGDGSEPCGCEPTHVPWNREPDTDVSVGASCDVLHHQDGDTDEHTEVCETRDFSSSPCDACGCPLAGSRHAYTWWA